MDDTPIPAIASAVWPDALARSVAELATGHTVPGAVAHQRIQDAIVRIDAKQAAQLTRDTVPGMD